MKRNSIFCALATLAVSVSAFGQDAEQFRKAQRAFDEYRFDDALEILGTYESQLKKKRKAVPEEVPALRTQILTMQNMLERVEKIIIIDSLVVDKEDFFTHYRLSPEAGKLFDASVLPPQYANDEPEVVYKPQCKGEIFWSRIGDDGNSTIVSAQILDDGTLIEPAALGDNLNEGGDADYFYMMSDGSTFYYANNGDNSIGGYDIFLSRRNGDGTVFQPQNVGMPYNSPYDDYMLVIDEQAGLGWWATDRNQIPNKVTIYVFVPNDTRVNYDPDDENIADYAKITSIAATQGDGVDVDRLLNNPALKPQSASQHDEPTFLFSLGNGKVYTMITDFKNAQARQSMRQYLDRLKDVEMMKRQLASMRQQYAQGDRSVAGDILTLEKRVSAAAPVLQRLRNQVITQENK